MKRWLLGIAAALLLLVGGVAVYLLTLDVDRFRDQILAQVQARTGRSASLGGPIELAISLHPTLVLSDLVIGPDPGRGAQPLLSAGRLEVQVALLPLLDGELRVRRLLVEGAQLHLERYADGGASWLFPSRGDAASAGWIPSLAKARVSNTRVLYTSARGTSTELLVDELTLGLRDADALLAFSFQGKLDGVALQAGGAAGRLAGLLDARAPYPLDASFEALGITAKLSGTIARPMLGEGLAAKLAVRSASLAPLSRHLELHLPPDLPLALDATVSGDASALLLRELVASLGENRVRGQLAVALAGDRPRVAGALHAERLDLLQLFPAAPGRAAARASRRVFSDAPVELAGLRALDADIEFSGDHVATPLGEVTALLARLVLDGGELRIDPLRARIDASAVDGSLALLAPRAQHIELRLALEARKLDTARVLRRFGQEAFVEGLADLSLKLRGQGASTAAIAASLDGRVKLLMGSGRGRLAGLDQVVGGLTRVLAEVAGGGSGEWTPIQCMAADFKLVDGIATREVLLLDTDAVTVAGEGRVDLRSERLDLEFTPRPKTTTLNMSLPVDVGGTLLEPTFSLDQGAAVRRAGGLLGGLLFPPAALAAFLDMGSGDDHPCAALAAAGAKQPAAAARQQPAKKKSGGLLDGVTDGIKSLFGR